jgi:Transposase DDE domain group 1
MLLGAADRQIRLIERFAGCFTDRRAADLVVHEVAGLVGQRVLGIALGYEDLIDHDQLRHDPVMAVLGGKLAARRADCAPLAGKSTLNRLELSRPEPTRYHKISHDAAAIEGLFVDLFLDAHAAPPPQITLDLDATDDPLHGHQEERFFHGYYDTYCYLPLYVFCGRHLLAAKLRPANIDASAGSVEEMARIVTRIRARWPQVRILLRADAGFVREGLMAWCENNGVDLSSGWPRTAGWLGRSRLNSPRRKSRAKRPKNRRAASRTSPGARAGVGAASVGLSPRRNGPAGKPIPALSSPHWRGRSMRPATSMKSSTAPAARWKTASRACPREGGGMPARPLCRPHLGPHDACQPAAAVVCFNGLCADLRPAPHRLGPYPVRPRLVRYHPPQAAEDRRPGAHQRAPHQAGDAVGLPLSGRILCRACCARRGALTPTRKHGLHKPAIHLRDHCP